MRVYSGECEHGKCGVETSLIDAKGEKLRIGDIVYLTTVDSFGVSGFYNLSVVVEDRPKLVGREKKEDPFIMGIKNVNIFTDENWRIVRVKKWEDVIDGEHWNDFGFNYKDQLEEK